MNTLPAKISEAIADMPASIAEEFTEALPVTAKGLATRLAIRIYPTAYFRRSTGAWMHTTDNGFTWTEDKDNAYVTEQARIVLTQIDFEASVLAALDHSPKGAFTSMHHRREGKVLAGTHGIIDQVLNYTGRILVHTPDLAF